MFGGLFGGNLVCDHHPQEWNIFKSRFTQTFTANNITDKSDDSGERWQKLQIKLKSHKSYKLVQRRGEDLTEWAALVLGLAQHYGFKNDLDVGLRHPFVLRLENFKEKEKPFAESVEELTLARVFDSTQCASSMLRRAKHHVRASDEDG
ncbi:hypothetical protein EVAR_84664_1 [Eumeta japonica]|uniref:Uncharacterized protein n=1 Tax=Eumeta variegata TaxID=151549 RepID=A0A4C1V022_EUMVA|nr:hypothetical protein EVAR_84664_1 [Eumeta japonica]